MCRCLFCYLVFGRSTSDRFSIRIWCFSSPFSEGTQFFIHHCFMFPHVLLFLFHICSLFIHPRSPSGSVFHCISNHRVCYFTIHFVFVFLGGRSLVLDSPVSGSFTGVVSGVCGVILSPDFPRLVMDPGDLTIDIRYISRPFFFLHIWWFATYLLR